jgi:hypothetical protein
MPKRRSAYPVAKRIGRSGYLARTASINCAPVIPGMATSVIRRWRDGFRYSKAGIVLIDLKPLGDLPEDLMPARDPVKSGRLMRALDGVTPAMDRARWRRLSPGIHKPWSMPRQKLTPRYTTHWDEILRARA